MPKTSQIDPHAKAIRELRSLRYQEMLEEFEIGEKLSIPRFLLAKKIPNFDIQEVWDQNPTGEELWESRDQGDKVRLQAMIVSVPSPKMAVLLLIEMCHSSGYSAPLLWFLNPTGTELGVFDDELKSQIKTEKARIEQKVEARMQTELSKVRARIAELEKELGLMKEAQK